MLECGTYPNFLNKILENMKEWTIWSSDMFDRHSGVITTDWATSELTRSVVGMLVCIEWEYMHIIVVIIIIIIILIN
jgi:hypothetical protein